MADTVAEAAHADEQCGEHERVDVADPQQLRAGSAQVGADERGGQGKHRAVDADEQDAQGEDAESEPAAGHDFVTPLSSRSTMSRSKSRAAARPTRMDQAVAPMRL